MNEQILQMGENRQENLNFIICDLKDIDGGGKGMDTTETSILINIFDRYKKDKKICSDKLRDCINKIIEILSCWVTDKNDELNSAYLSLIKKLKELKKRINWSLLFLFLYISMLKYKVNLKDGSSKIVSIRDYNEAVPKMNEKLASGEWKDYEVLP